MRVLAGLLLVASLLGCRGSRLTPAALPLSPPPYRFVIGHSVEGRPVEAIVLGQGADTTLLIASIHGNEGAGTPLALRLAHHLQQVPVLLAGRRIVLVPAANPDGLAAHTRGNAHGVDLNRNFRAANHTGKGALSEPESRYLAALVRTYRPDRILTLHAPLACVDYDGPARSLAERVAQACDLPVRKLGARGGSLGSWAGVDLGIPVVTLELPADTNGMDEQGLWDRYGDALVAALGP